MADCDSFFGCTFFLICFCLFCCFIVLFCLLCCVIVLFCFVLCASDLVLHVVFCKSIIFVCLAYSKFEICITRVSQWISTFVHFTSIFYNFVFFQGKPFLRTFLCPIMVLPFLIRHHYNLYGNDIIQEEKIHLLNIFSQ